MLLSGKVLDDDLFVVVAARPQSVSYSDTMTELPGFLQKYFTQNNLMVIYPEQFGQEVALTSFVDPMAADIAATPSPLWRRLRALRRLLKLHKPHSNQKPHSKCD